MTSRRDDARMVAVGELLGDALQAYPLEGTDASAGMPLAPSVQGQDAFPSERAFEQDDVAIIPAPLSQGAQAEASDSLPLAGRVEHFGGRSEPATLTLFGTSDPIAIIEKASRVATGLKAVIVRQKLFQEIKSTNKKTGLITRRNYVTVEGWTLLGSMLGVFAHIEWTRRIKGDGADYSKDGWEARASAIVAASGMTIGVGEAQCTREESLWSGRDDYALRAMAQTRAISRTLRAPLGFVIKLAGFEATGAEEMPT